ncbi:hypothetical protein DSCO28_55470 [Desulfosarcina ovata subsp. sediminis]|uniref:Uncharacterized protein n=1 Tax=Desulfosarcina ovata subsp. sediminis TaxID=885957 RepID=A0A5K7ZXZ8_9BACT|nr:hypothetical protein DSCO28_55470 [Desulfosarcina ovata subsp. sediminis]
MSSIYLISSSSYEWSFSATLKGLDLASIADFVDFMRYQKKIKPQKVLKLQGILKGHDIDLSDLDRFKAGFRMSGL